MRTKSPRVRLILTIGGVRWCEVGQLELHGQETGAGSASRREVGAVFLGTYTPKLDDKGRLTLPAKFRDALAGGVMVTKGQDHSLAVYPRAEFEVRARKAADASRTNEAARAFVRAMAAGTDEQHADGQGRITLSADHRRYAGLAKECVVIGSVDFLEIWDAQSWQTYLDANEESYSQAREESLGDIL